MAECNKQPLFESSGSDEKRLMEGVDEKKLCRSCMRGQKKGLGEWHSAVASLVLLLLLGNRVALLVDETLLAHDLQSIMERVKLGLGRPVRVEVAVGPGEVLAVVDVEVHVVQRVVSRAVDVLLEPVAGDHVAVMDEDGPDLHEDEQHQVEVLLDGADEDEDTVKGSVM